MTATTLGERIREAREAKDITQQAIGNHLKISRSAIAQWESNTTSPSLPTLVELSRLIDSTPEYLAFGIKDGVRTVYRAPENSGLHTVDVVAFDKPEEERKVGSFAVDDGYLRELSEDNDVASLRGFIVPANNLVEGMKRGDRVVVDTSIQQPRQAAVYLYWNGFGASLAQMAPTMGEDGPVVRLTEGGQTSTTGLNKVKILGRVVAHWTTL